MNIVDIMQGLSGVPAMADDYDCLAYYQKIWIGKRATEPPVYMADSIEELR
jgi:hypothetical protein